MKDGRALCFAILLFLLALLKLLFPAGTEALRAWAEQSFAPGLEERIEAWGRTLAGEGERVAALGGETGP